ncbi:MAG TPA: hypothetical protein VM262_01305 [Acidimicrobiales bacterium]|nr:hypothetical protein [Acidimicrobiales bacterium]
MSDPSPGAARREGRGYISSFGAGRSCREPSCPTILSRYNEKETCWLHDQRARGIGDNGAG